jgi:hypothetical protein
MHPKKRKKSFNSIKNGASLLTERMQSPSTQHISLPAETITNHRFYRTVTPAEKPEGKQNPKSSAKFQIREENL